MQTVQKYFSFAEIVQGRDASVRVTPDGLLYAVDLVMVVTGKNRDEAGMVLRRIPEDVFLSIKMIDKKMPGRGNAHTKLLTFQDAIDLIMVLPGQTAKEIRTQFASIIQRYLAGDHTLISEIQANAVSSSPVAQLARESLQISVEQDLNRKRLREELELEKLTMENKQNNFNFFLGSMNDLDPNWKKDTRLLTQTKDLLKNICFGSQAITNEASTVQSTPIYIHEIAIKLGFGKLTHGDACKIGRKAVEMYRAKYNAEPPTRLQYVDGAERQVKCYTEADRDLIEAAVRGVMLV